MRATREQKISKLELMLKRVQQNQHRREPRTSTIPDVLEADIAQADASDAMSEMETTRPPGTFPPGDELFEVAQPVGDEQHQPLSARSLEEFTPSKVEPHFTRSQAVAVMVGELAHHPSPDFNALVAASLSLTMLPSD